MKLWPTALHAANLRILLKINGFFVQNSIPPVNSPSANEIIVATAAINRFVQNIKSYGFGLTPKAFEVFLMRFCIPPVTPSQVNDAKMNKIPTNDDAGPDFLPKETRTVPAMIALTAAYSRRVYLAPPNNNVPIEYL